LDRIKTRKDVEEHIYPLPTNKDIKDAQYRHHEHKRTTVTLAGLPADAPDLRLDVVWLKRRTRLFRYYVPGLKGRGEDCDALTKERCADNPNASPLFLTFNDLSGSYGTSACIYMLERMTPYLLLDYDNLAKLAYLLHHHDDILDAHGIEGVVMEEFLGMFYPVDFEDADFEA
jgi:hypothetical protein